MKKLLLIFLCVPVFGWTQKKDTVFRYFDEHLQLTSEKDAVFYGVSLKRNDHWFLMAVYPDTTPILNIYFKDRDLKIRDGRYVLYYPKYIRSVDGFYSNNKKDSVWQSFYENGQLKESGRFKLDIMVGEWNSWYQSGVRKTRVTYSAAPDERTLMILSGMGNLNGLKEGPYASWYSNGNSESEGTYHNNIEEGEWNWYYENGRQATKEIYRQGKLASLTCYDSTGKETGDLCSIAKPATVKVFGDYREYIKENLVWPEEAIKKKIEGVVTIKLTISKNGQILSKEIKGDHPVLEKAILDLFANLSEWYPAISHNRPVEWSDEFQIPFQFQK